MIDAWPLGSCIYAPFGMPRYGSEPPLERPPGCGEGGAARGTMEAGATSSPGPRGVLPEFIHAPACVHRGLRGGLGYHLPWGRDSAAVCAALGSPISKKSPVKGDRRAFHGSGHGDVGPDKRITIASRAHGAHPCAKRSFTRNLRRGFSIRAADPGAAQRDPGADDRLHAAPPARRVRNGAPGEGPAFEPSGSRERGPGGQDVWAGRRSGAGPGRVGPGRERLVPRPRPGRSVGFPPGVHAPSSARPSQGPRPQSRAPCAFGCECGPREMG